MFRNWQAMEHRDVMGVQPPNYHDRFPSPAY